MKHAMANADQVAAVREFMKRFCANGYWKLYNNKRKNFRLLKWWGLEHWSANDLKYFCEANKIPYKILNRPVRPDFYLYTDLAA